MHRSRSKDFRRRPETRVEAQARRLEDEDLRGVTFTPEGYHEFVACSTGVSPFFFPRNLSDIYLAESQSTSGCLAFQRLDCSEASLAWLSWELHKLSAFESPMIGAWQYGMKVSSRPPAPFADSASIWNIIDRFAL